MKRFIDYMIQKTYLTSITLSVILAALCEFWGRRSITLGIKFILDKPLVFLINVYIVFLTFMFASFFKRRLLYYLVVTSIWAAIGITNGVMLGYRNTPFTFVDVQLAKAGFAVMNNYMSILQILGLILGAALLLGILVILFFIAPKYDGPRSIKKHIIVAIVAIAGFSGLSYYGLETGAIVKRFANLNLSYKAYGVPYCFSVTFVDNGITMPLNYSKNKMNQIQNAIQKIPETTPEKRPNIIFLQLESFFDVNHLKDVTFSSNPLPYFTKLKEEYTSGFLKVPTYGAGTVNTEFEIITGMNRNYFGAGEYPYKSVLQKSTSESINYDLKNLGYKSHAIHNNTATFYDRNLVFSHLGFDTFTSSEYMDMSDMTDNGWMKDKILTEEIMKSLKSTAGQDFVYAISVQGHGEYPTEPMEDSKFSLTGLRGDEGRTNSLAYYANAINEMDNFLIELTDALSKSGEDTVLVLYGDHLPSINFSKSELTNKSIYETEYVIWNNFNLPKEDEELEAYQLTAKVLGMVGMNEGVLTKYHQNYKESKNYYKNLKLLEYDMLYGKKYIYDRKNPFDPTILKMGVVPIQITQVEELEDGVMINGRHFTQRSAVYLGDRRKDTEYISSTQLFVKGLKLKNEDHVAVVQETKNHTKLSTTSQYHYKEVKE